MNVNNNEVLYSRSKQITFGPADYINSDSKKLTSREINNISKYSDFEEEENDMSIPDEL